MSFLKHKRGSTSNMSMKTATYGPQMALAVGIKASSESSQVAME